jgi:glucose-6-phosphate 1-dehydrogenase
MSLNPENDCPEGNPEGLKLLRESLKKVELSSSSSREGSHVFVVFGASGDLARKKIYPTLWALYRDSLMPKVGVEDFACCLTNVIQGTHIFGYARSKMTVTQLREKCVGTVKAKEGEEDLLEQFWAANHYVAGSYDNQGDFQRLNQEMVAVEKGIANCLFYLALPPSVFKPVTSMLKVSLAII